MKDLGDKDLGDSESVSKLLQRKQDIPVTRRLGQHQSQRSDSRPQFSDHRSAILHARPCFPLSHPPQINDGDSCTETETTVILLANL
jgi:hypothetical protein